MVTPERLDVAPDRHQLGAQLLQLLLTVLRLISVQTPSQIENKIRLRTTREYTAFTLHRNACQGAMQIWL